MKSSRYIYKGVLVCTCVYMNMCIYEQGDIYTINIHSEMPSYPWNTVQQPLYYFGKNRPTYLCYLVLCGLHFKLIHLLENSFCLFSFDVDHF